MTNKSNTNTYILIQGVLTCILALCFASTFAQDQLKTRKTTTSDFTTTLLVDQTPKEAFNAINDVRGWWSEEIEGSTDKLNDEFTYHYEDVHYCQLKVIEVIPNKKVVWLVKYNHFNFTKDKSEWTGTKIIFEISEKDKKTRVRFTHLGLVPAYECFNICSNAWSQYIQQSLFSLITTGKGRPNQFNKRVKAQ
ncbi:MAG TPA: SRPBCC domain-containing protein [Patescibacteria group bacterium]